MIEVLIDVPTRNPLNQRRHWWRVARDAKTVRRLTWGLLRRKCRRPPVPPVVVTMTRLSAGKMDDGCGLNAALKPVRDGVADWLKVDDADPQIRWEYRQERAPRGRQAVRVQVE